MGVVGTHRRRCLQHVVRQPQSLEHQQPNSNLRACVVTTTPNLRLRKLKAGTVMRLTGTLRTGACLLLALIATKVAADSGQSRPTYYPAYDYDSPYNAGRDVEEKSGHLPLSPHYPSHGRPPSYERPAPTYTAPAPSYKPPAYEPPVYKPKPVYKPEPEYHSPPAYKPPSPSYHEPAYKPKPSYHEPAYKPKPAYQELAYKPKPTYEEPHHGSGYKAKNSIPGEAGVDYPVYNKIPHTKFSCESVPYRPGMYANPVAGCQVYHVCNDDRYGVRGAEFLCTNGTIFNQETFSCDWWYNVDCNKATSYYDLNLDPKHNPYYKEPYESREISDSYKPDPYKPLKPTYHRPTPSYHKPAPNYHKPQPSYHAPAPKPSYQYTPKPTYHAPTPKPYHAPTPKPYHAPAPKPYHAPTPKPTYHASTTKPSYRAPTFHTPAPSYNRPKPSYQSPTPKPSYRSPSPKPTYHTPAPSYQPPATKPSYHAPSPKTTYHTPAPNYHRSTPSHRTPSPSPPSYRTPSPPYRPPTHRPVYHEPKKPVYREPKPPVYHEPEPSYHAREELEYDYGTDFEWGAKFT